MVVVISLHLKISTISTTEKWFKELYTTTQYQIAFVIFSSFLLFSLNMNKTKKMVYSVDGKWNNNTKKDNAADMQKNTHTQYAMCDAMQWKENKIRMKEIKK